MAMTNTIKAGYRLTVSSWENDLDSRNNVQKDGLNLDEVKFYVDILRLYKSGNLGNIYQPTEKERKEEAIALRKVIDKYPNAQKYLGLCDAEDMKDDEAIVMCVHESVLYEYMGGGEFYTRHLESYKVEYIPVEIKIEDVTSTLFKL